VSGAVLRYMATAPRGLADLVARELRTLGVTELAERTGIRLRDIAVATAGGQ